MRRKFIFLLTGLMCISLILSGCSFSLSIGKDPTTAIANGKNIDLMADVKAQPWSETPSIPDQVWLQGISRFSARLLQESVKNKGNVMISPASVFLALAMTVNGADSTTRDAMLSVLADQNITVDQINQISRDWMALLEKSEPKTRVSIVNSIWFRDGFVPYKPFLQSNADYYKAGARQLDFADEQAPDIINAWVKDATNDLIDKIIDKISPSTVMYLINAIYFKADWMTPFEKHETREQDFNTPDGTVKVDFMHRTGPMQYFVGQQVSGVSLPYHNEQFAYFAILPDEGIDPRTWLNSQDPAALLQTISAMMAQKANTTISLALPRYEVSYEDSLINELETMGMGIAFDGSEADFSRLNESRTKGLFISEVKHKTVIRVDEKGTEAAAVTSVAIDESANWADIELTFDRPFIYGIMDLKTNLPLFVGILEDPTGD
jgi:serpin B